MTSQFLFLLSTILYLLSMTLADSVKSSYSPSDILNPLTGSKATAFCGRFEVERSTICDPNLLLTKAAKDTIEGFINEATTSQMGVLVIPAMDRQFMGSQSIDQAAERFARAIHDSWGVGDSVTNNGVLIFLSVKDRAYYVSTGAGVAKYLTLRHIHSVFDHAKSKLRANDIGGALEGVVVEINMIISKPDAYANPNSNYLSAKSGAFLNEDGLSWLIVGGIFAVALVFMKWESDRKKELERGKTALSKLMTEVKHMEQGNKYKSTSCPICLEDFPTCEEEEFSRTTSLNMKTGEIEETPKKGDVELANVIADNEGEDEDDLLLRIDKSAPVSSDANESKANNSAGLQDQHRPMSLQCGHVFCYECLLAHLKSSAPGANRCPICREPVDPMAPRPVPAPHPGPGPGVHSNGIGGDRSTGSGGSCSVDTSEQPSAPATATDNGVFESASARSSAGYPSSSYLFRHHRPELLFRLHRMRYLYPNVMTAESYGALHVALDANSIAQFTAAAERRVLAVDTTLTEMREAAKRSGSSGSSRVSFGGGRSSGGGGGRW